MDSLTKNPLLLWLVISVAVGALAWTFLRKELRTKAILYGRGYFHRLANTALSREGRSAEGTRTSSVSVHC